MRATPQSFLRHPLSAVFANPANVRVLRELARHGGELSSTVLVGRTRLSKPSVTASLAALVDFGLVESLGWRRQALYRIDGKHPLASTMAEMFRAEDRRFQSVLEVIRAAAAGAGVIAAWLYGSVARGEDRWDSDVDVAVVATDEGVKEKVREELSEQEDALRFSASIVGIDLNDVARLVRDDDPWWRQLLVDAVPLVGPEPHVLAHRLPGTGRRGRDQDRTIQEGR